MIRRPCSVLYQHYIDLCKITLAFVYNMSPVLGAFLAQIHFPKSIINIYMLAMLKIQANIQLLQC